MRLNEKRSTGCKWPKMQISTPPPREEKMVDDDDDVVAAAAEGAAAAAIVNEMDEAAHTKIKKCSLEE